MPKTIIQGVGFDPGAFPKITGDGTRSYPYYPEAGDLLWADKNQTQVLFSGPNHFCIGLEGLGNGSGDPPSNTIGHKIVIHQPAFADRLTAGILAIGFGVVHLENISMSSEYKISFEVSGADAETAGGAKFAQIFYGDMNPAAGLHFTSSDVMGLPGISIWVEFDDSKGAPRVFALYGKWGRSSNVIT